MIMEDENRHAVRFQALIEPVEVLPLQLVIARSCAFKGRPENVKSHFCYFVGRELGQTFHTPESHDREGLAALPHAGEEFPGPSGMDEKVFVDDDETAQGMPCILCLLLHEKDRFIKLTAAPHKGDIFAVEKVGSAAEIASVGTPEPARDVGHLRVEGIGKDPRRFDGCVRVPDGAIGVLAQEPSHETDAFFPTDEVPEGSQLTVRKHRAVTA